MAITYTQTNTSETFDVGCSGQSAGASTAARRAEVSASAGTTEVTTDPDNQTTAACFAFSCFPAPNETTWQSGDYTVNINHSTMDGGTQLTRVDVCDFDGATYQTVAANTSPGHTRGASGTLSVDVNRATDYAVQSQANSRVFVVLTYNNNDDHGSSSLGVTPSLTIVTPDAVSGGVKPQRALRGVGV